MARPMSKINPAWWDYTTLEEELLKDVSQLTVTDIQQLARPGFEICMYDTMDSFWLAEALEYVQVWRQSTENEPKGICGPIGPTEQLPLVAQIVNDLEIDVRSGHFWGMDEWYDTDTQCEVPQSHPLSFARADLELCFNRINPRLRMPDKNIHFPTVKGLAEYSASFDEITPLLMQGGQGEVKHWAFNDPLRREGKDQPPSPAHYRKLGARIVELHPLTLIQNARTSFAGQVSGIPTHAISVGPCETWKCETVSIWHPGIHDNPFGMRLTAFMISKKLADSSVPMSLLADHPHVRFNFFRPGIGDTGSEMH